MGSAGFGASLGAAIDSGEGVAGSTAEATGFSPMAEEEGSGPLVELSASAVSTGSAAGSGTASAGVGAAGWVWSPAKGVVSGCDRSGVVPVTSTSIASRGVTGAAEGAGVVTGAGCCSASGRP